MRNGTSSAMGLFQRGVATLAFSAKDELSVLDDLMQRYANVPMQQGVGFANFYTSTTCSRTRSMMLSGTDTHLAGLRNMGEMVGALAGEDLDEVGMGITYGYQINDNLSPTVSYMATVEDGPGDLDMGEFRISLAYGWHQLIEGMKRLVD